MSYVEIRDLVVRYNEFEALKGVSFSVAERERICLLGPSGCGKTTTLQVMAGFIAPSEGQVLLAGRNLIGLAPERRNIGIMFQNYALFPHMTVFDNVAFGLRMRGVAADEIRRRVTAALERVRLAHAAQKMPTMLSGGEQQRIAFARAVVIQPSLLLLDEPFSNLDARLRLEMRSELLELLAGLPIATIMVTHDQEEAMAIADRIVVMRSGAIQQVGTPSEIYDSAASLFVARFVGDSNLLSGRVASVDRDTADVEVPGIGRIRGKNHGLAAGAAAQVLVRPQRVLLARSSTAEADDNVFPATIERVLFLGHRSEIHVRTGDGSIFIVWAQGHERPDFRAGEAVALAWKRSDTFVFPAEG